VLFDRTARLADRSTGPGSQAADCIVWSTDCAVCFGAGSAAIRKKRENPQNSRDKRLGEELMTTHRREEKT